MTGIGSDLEAAVDKEADTHTTKVTNAVKAAATPDNGGKTAAGDPTDVQEQVVAVLAANPPSWLFLVGAFAILGAGVAAGYVVLARRATIGLPAVVELRGLCRPLHHGSGHRADTRALRRLHRSLDHPEEGTSQGHRGEGRTGQGCGPGRACRRAGGSAGCRGSSGADHRGCHRRRADGAVASRRRREGASPVAGEPGGPHVGPRVHAGDGGLCLGGDLPPPLRRDAGAQRDHREHSTAASTLTNVAGLPGRRRPRAARRTAGSTWSSPGSSSGPGQSRSTTSSPIFSRRRAARKRRPHRPEPALVRRRSAPQCAGARSTAGSGTRCRRC